MSRARPWPLFGAVTFFYLVGAVGHLVVPLRPLLLALTPWFLLASASAVLVAAALDDPGAGWGRALALWFLPVLGLTFGLEVLGVATGAVFGPYHYTPVLGALVAGVPPVIGLNWVLVVLGVHSGLRRLGPRLGAPARVVLTGLVCVAFDLLLEPVALGLGYWVWDAPAVPLQNYLAWGLIAALGALGAEALPRLPRSGVLGAYVALQALFFAFLGLFLGAWARFPGIAL